jgi:hypothetical protein
MVQIPFLDRMLRHTHTHTYTEGLKISAVRGSGRTASRASSFYFVGIVAVFSIAPKGYRLRPFGEENGLDPSRSRNTAA